MLRVGLRPLLLAAVFGTLAAQAAATTSFDVSTFDQPVGSDAPQVLHLADVNDDGLDDLFAVDFDGDRVAVYLNDEEGGFADAEFLDTPGGPLAVATGDFDRNGDLDLITANSAAGSISVFLGDGSGTFDGNQRRDTAVATGVRGLVIADFNDDSVDDVAVLTSDRIYFMRSTSDGSFARFNPDNQRTRTSTGSSFAVAGGSIDAGASVDLVVSNRQDSQLAVFLSNEDGTFNFSAGGLLNVGAEASGVIAVDADDDDDVDLIAVDPAAQVFDEVRVFLNEDGQGAFADAQSVTANEEPFAIAALDVDGNGKVDLAVTTLTNNPISLLCQPSSICNLSFTGEPLEAGIWRQGRFEAGLAMGQGQVAVVSGTLNDDSLDDLVALGSDLSTIAVFLNTSTAGTPSPTTPSGNNTPTLTPTGPTATPTRTPTPPATATPTSVPTIPLGDCRLELAASSPADVEPSALVTADFDLDGDLDVAVADEPNDRILVYLTSRGSGSSSGDACSRITLSRAPTIRDVLSPRYLVAADFDRDSRPDLAVLGEEGVSVYFGSRTTNGGFESAEDFVPIEAGVDPARMAVADFNRDGTPDLLVSDAGGTSLHMLFGVAGRDDPFDGESCPINVRKRSAQVVVTDLNRDSRPDFAFTSGQSRDLSVFLRDPANEVDCLDVAAAFDALAPIDLGAEPRGLLADAFDLADAVPDLVAARAPATAAGDLRFYVGQPASSGSSVRYGSATTLADGGNPLLAPVDIATGDINRDARLDLVVLDSDSSNNLVVYLGGNDGRFGAPLIPVTTSPDGAEATALTVADVDSDRRADILVAHLDGTLTFFLSSDPPATSTPAPTATPTPIRSETPTQTFTPTITMTPTRTVRATSTQTPVPTETPRGVIRLNGSTCAIAATPATEGTAWLACGAALLLAARRRRP